MCRIKNFRICLKRCDLSVWWLEEQLCGFGQMRTEGCAELWWLALGCVCALQAGSALLNISPLASCWQCPHLGKWEWICPALLALAGSQSRQHTLQGALHPAQLGASQAFMPGQRVPYLCWKMSSSLEGERKGNLEPPSSYLWAAIHCLCFQNFVPDLIVVGNCLLVNFPQCECKCCSNSHVAYSWSCTNRWGSYIKSIFDNLVGFAKA